MRNFNAATIVNTLTERGYNATTQEVNKNGVIKMGVTIREEGENVAPTIYLDGLKAETDMDAAEEIIRIYESLEKPEFDVTFITSYDKAKDNLRICVAGEGKADTVAKSVMDLEVYARVLVQDGSTKVTEQLLKIWGKTLDEVLTDAEQNTFSDVKHFSMADFVMEVTGAQVDEIPMEIVTNTEKHMGAIQMFNIEVLSEVAEKFDNDLYILPSNIHEVIALPAEGNLLMLAEMVKEVNSVEVSPEEQLSNSVYKFDRKEKRLTLAQ